MNPILLGTGFRSRGGGSAISPGTRCLQPVCAASSTSILVLAYPVIRKSARMRVFVQYGNCLFQRFTGNPTRAILSLILASSFAFFGIFGPVMRTSWGSGRSA